MYMRVLPVGEARRRLPELVRKVAAGQPAVAIGRRGRPEAMLGPVHPPSVGDRRPLRGLLELVGTPEDVARAENELQALVAEALARSLRELTGRKRRYDRYPRR